MNRKLKAMGLALVAALALTAVMASAAQANFHSNKTHTIISGEQENSHVFTAGEGFGGITCSKAAFSGTATGLEEESQLITPVYEGCKDTFGRTVDPENSLQYRFTTDGTVHVTGEMILKVTSGSSVVCTVTIKPQTDNGITYDNLGGTSGVRVTTSSTNVVSTTSGGFLNCGVSNGEHKAGTYEGNTVITGKDTEGAAAEISVTNP